MCAQIGSLDVGYSLDVECWCLELLVTGMAIVSINPATGEKLKEFSPFDDAEIAKRLKLAENASSKYRRTRFIDRRCFWKLWQSCYSRKRKNSLRSSPWRWGNCCALQWKKLKSAPAVADFTRRMASDFWRTNRRRPMPLKVTCSINRSDPCSPSCRGIFRSGRYFDSLRRRSWRAMSDC